MMKQYEMRIRVGMGWGGSGGQDVFIASMLRSNVLHFSSPKVYSLNPTHLEVLGHHRVDPLLGHLEAPVVVIVLEEAHAVQRVLLPHAEVHLHRQCDTCFGLSKVHVAACRNPRRWCWATRRQRALGLQNSCLNP